MEKLLKLSEEDLIELYNKNINKLKYLKDDIIATEKALENKNIDYLTKRDFLNDITANRLTSNRIEKEQTVIKECATLRGIVLEKKKEKNKKMVKAR